jgi:hypothetical protein
VKAFTRRRSQGEDPDSATTVGVAEGQTIVLVSPDLGLSIKGRASAGFDALHL